MPRPTCHSCDRDLPDETDILCASCSYEAALPSDQKDS